MRALSNRREIVEALESAHEDGVEYWSQFGTTTGTNVNLRYSRDY